MTRVRDIAKILGVTEASNPTNAVLTSTADGSGGVTVYATKEDLPSSGLTSGDQAYVTANSRFYISNGSGWYNVALINATPSLTIDPTGSIALSTEGATTTITLTATDSDNALAGLTYSVDSDGNFGGLASISQDSSVFTITPLSEDSATTASAVLTFKASDGISFGSGTTTFSLAFSTIVENSNYTTLLAKADTAGTDNQVDASTNNYTITESGNVTSTAFTPYHPGGYSTYFSGTDDYLGFDNGYIATNGTWWTSSGFTLEMWYYKTISRSIALWDNRQSNTNGFMFLSYTDGYHMYNNSSWQFQSVGTEKLNQWVHVALVINGTALTLYENGVSIHTDSVASTASYGYFGRPQNTLGTVQYTPRGGATEFAGYMYDVRISVGSRYTTAFTPLDTPLENDNDTILLACSSPMLKDKSSNNHEITVFGDGISTTRFGPHDYDPYTKADHGGAVYFDGSGDYLEIPHNTNLNLNGVDWTIEFWYWWDGGQTGYQGIVGKRADNVGWTLALDNGTASSGKKLLWYNNGNALEATPSIFPNKWYHIALVRQSGVIKYYNNGVERFSVTSDAYSSTSTVTIGVSQGVGHLGETISGYLSDLRIVKGTAVYTSNFTPPTAPLTAITNTSLLTCTNKNDIWDASAGSLLTKVGNTTASNTQRQFTSSSAMYFDGSSAVENTIDAIGTSDFCIEGWVNITADTASNYQMVFDNRTSLTTGPYLFYYEVDDKLYGYLDSTSFASDSTISQNTWYHWALVRNSNACTFYLNGVAQTSNAGTSITTNFSGTEFNIGRNSSVGSPANGSYFYGYQQDFRVTKGLARYTSNFTPPTAEFDG